MRRPTGGRPTVGSIACAGERAILKPCCTDDRWSSLRSVQNAMPTIGTSIARPQSPRSFRSARDVEDAVPHGAPSKSGVGRGPVPRRCPAGMRRPTGGRPTVGAIACAGEQNNSKTMLHGRPMVVPTECAKRHADHRTSIARPQSSRAFKRRFACSKAFPKGEGKGCGANIKLHLYIFG